jgi:hypothetical protein
MLSQGKAASILGIIRDVVVVVLVVVAVAVPVTVVVEAIWTVTARSPSTWSIASTAG